MDRSRFTADLSGELVEIEIPRRDIAFVPAPLPPSWVFPTDLWPILAEAKQELARLDGIARTLPNPELLLRPLQSREALRSSSLEGTYATPRELLLFEFQPREPTSEHDPANAQREVANYSNSLRRGLILMKELPFCLRLVRQLHLELLSGVRGRNKAPGEFRKTQNHIGSDFRFIPPPPHLLQKCLDNFEREINSGHEAFDPLVYCYLLHYQFEAIHPFLDGNGRVGRVLLSLMIYQKCQLTMPWLYMSAYFERYRDEYIDNMFRVSTHSDWSRWIAFCLKGTISQAVDSIRRCELLMALKDKFLSSLGTAGPRAHPIVEGLFKSPVLTIPEVARRYGVTYPTAKSDVTKLQNLGILQEVHGIHPKHFYCGPILEIAFDEDDF